MSPDRSPGSRRPVGSVARAIALLDALAESERGLGVNELARRIGVNASTASRLLGTLERGRLVERSPGGPYRLGLRLVALSDRVLGQLDVRERARPWLAWLVEETGETATLSVPGGGDAITVDFVPSGSSVVSMARLGRPSVSHATAAGKVMLAFAGSDPRPSEDGRLVAYTERTITDPGVLAVELEAVRERGIAEAVGEREPDLNALAVPVLGRGGELVAILGLQGPAARLPASKRRALQRPLLRAAAEVGRSLGGPVAEWGWAQARVWRRGGGALCGFHATRTGGRREWREIHGG
jgi:DNA-binding IclR family transcriptional regulator